MREESHSVSTGMRVEIFLGRSILIQFEDQENDQKRLTEYRKKVLGLLEVRLEYAFFKA